MEDGTEWLTGVDWTLDPTTTKGDHKFVAFEGRIEYDPSSAE